VFLRSIFSNAKRCGAYRRGIKCAGGGSIFKDGKEERGDDEKIS